MDARCYHRQVPASQLTLLLCCSALLLHLCVRAAHRGHLLAQGPEEVLFWLSLTARSTPSLMLKDLSHPITTSCQLDDAWVGMGAPLT